MKLLGGFSIRRAPSEPVHLPPNSPALLFARLALSPGRRFSREMLCDLLWPGEDLDVARPRLRTTLVRAREFFGETSPIEADKLEIWLDPIAAAVDYDELQRRLKRLPTEAPQDRSGKALEAIQAYTGPLLPDFQDHWIVAARRDLIDSICKLALSTAQELAGERNWEAAISILTQSLRCEPINEEISMALLDAYEKAERYAEGVKASWDIRSSWQRDLGSDPPPAVRAIESILWSKLASPRLKERTKTRSGLIGREKELDEVRSLIERNRCVSLVGIGGVGKTSLARVIFEEAEPGDPSGPVFVDLCDVRPDADLCQTLLRTMGAAEQADVPCSEQLCETLAAQSRVVILDNCEHLIEGCRSLGQLLLDRTVSTRILITSRIPVGLQREVLYDVSGLRLPGDKEVEHSDAVRMFVETGHKWLPRQIGPEELSTIASITRQLDGIPLAMELAAARLRVLSLEEIRSRLEQNFDLLNAPNPRRSVPGLIEWSMSRLSESALKCLLNLSVFSAGWSVDEIAAALEWKEEALDAVTELMESFLIQRTESSDKPRFRLLESVKAIALEQLEDAGLDVEARDRHLRAYAELARWIPKAIPTSDNRRYLGAYQTADANLMSAFRWAVARPTVDGNGLLLAEGLVYYICVRGTAFEGEKLYADLLARNDPFPSLENEATVLLAHGRMQWTCSDVTGARVSILRSLAICEQEGFQKKAYSCHSQLGATGITSCDLDLAEHHYGSLAKLPDEERLQKWGVFGLSTVANLRCQFQRGIDLSLQTIQKAAGFDDMLVIHSRSVLSECAIRLGLEIGYEQANRAMEEAGQCGDKYHIGYVLHVLAEYEREKGNFAEAQRLCDRLIDVRTAFGERRTIGMAHCLRANLALMSGDPKRCLEHLCQAEKTAVAEFRWLVAVGYDPLRARALMDLGRWAEAEDALREGFARPIPVWREAIQTDLLMAHAEFRYRSGEPERGASSLVSTVRYRADRGWIWYADARRPGSPLDEIPSAEVLNLDCALERAQADLRKDRT